MSAEESAETTEDDARGIGGIAQYQHKRTSFDEFKTGYSKISDANKKLDAKNELWHAVRIGMITAANYKTITGEDYPNIPPVRVETKAAL